MPIKGTCFFLNLMQEEQWISYIRQKKVCLCSGLSQEDLEKAIQKYNIRSFNELQYYTKCCTHCGTCKEKVLEILKKNLNYKKN